MQILKKKKERVHLPLSSAFGMGRGGARCPEHMIEILVGIIGVDRCNGRWIYLFFLEPKIIRNVIPCTDLNECQVRARVENQLL